MHVKNVILTIPNNDELAVSLKSFFEHAIFWLVCLQRTQKHSLKYYPSESEISTFASLWSFKDRGKCLIFLLMEATILNSSATENTMQNVQVVASLRI